MGQISTKNCFHDSFCIKLKEKKSKTHPRRRTMSVSVPNEDGARISRTAPHRKPVKFFYFDATTLVEALERGRKLSGDGHCVGWRSSPSEYSWLIYSEFREKAINFGSGLINIGADLGQLSKVGIYGKNSVEWVIAMYGCLYYSTPIVPLYDTLGPDASSYMINHGKIQYIVCDDEKKVKILLDKKDDTPSLEAIICTAELSDEVKLLGEEKHVSIHSFESVLDLGKKNPYPIKKPHPEDMVELCYTSGTTGNPKGVILTHENWMAAAGGLLSEMGSLAFTKSDVSISYLPLAHSFEQIVQVSS
nr:long-chain-fatty-acid--CoA ligase 6-like [Parasteatoda tepidariorum]